VKEFFEKFPKLLYAWGTLSIYRPGSASENDSELSNSYS
jgi:hypothetical protein